MASHLKGQLSPHIILALALVASGESIRKAAQIAGCSPGGLWKAIVRQRQGALTSSPP